LTGGQRLGGDGLDKGFFFAPTVFRGSGPEMRIAREEVFGPVVSVIECDSFDQAIAFANGIQYGLSTALYSRNVNLAFKAVRDLEAGITYINAPTIGAEVHLPFGGVKQTGNGHREGGTGALDFYTSWKAVYVDYSDRLQRAQIDTGEFASIPLRGNFQDDHRRSQGSERPRIPGGHHTCRRKGARRRKPHRPRANPGRRPLRLHRR
jgi:delta 1-pyrroline-5-carboxylate dehydrogenase